MTNHSSEKRSAENDRKRLSIFLAVAFALIAFLHFSSVNDEINGLGGDNAGYILLAKSLASLNGYRDFVPGNTLHTTWPPVFPLLLVPVIWLFGINFTVCHLVVVVTELIALILLYFLFRRQAGQSMAILSCAVFALNPYVNLSLVRILSEFPCLMVTAAALLLAEKEKNESKTHIQYFWLPILVSIVYLTRTAGLSLLTAFFLYRVYQKQFKLLLWNTPILIIPYMVWTLRARLSGLSDAHFNIIWLKSYRDPALGTTSISDFIERIWSNIQNIAQYIGDYFVVPFAHDLSIIILLIICGLIISGFCFRWFKKQISLMEFYVPVYILMLIIWPVFEPRKLMPVMPFIYLYLFLGIHWFVCLLSFNRSKVVAKLKNGQRALQTSLAVRLICIFLIAGQVPPTIELLKIRSAALYYPKQNAEGYNDFTIDWSHYAEVTSWIKSGGFLQYAPLWANYFYISNIIGQLTPPDAVIIARKATLSALYSGRRTIGYPLYRNFDKQQNNITKNDVDYILLDGMFVDTEKYLMPYIKSHADAFHIIAKKGRAYLLKVVKDGSSPKELE